MGQKYIVLGRKADNSVEMLASPSVEFGKMKDVLHKNTRNENFDEVQMFALMPHTRAYHAAATLKMEADIKAQEEAAKKKTAGPDPDKGPTVQEFVAAGYNPKNYPPTGFNSKSSPEEIAEACEEYAAKTIPQTNEFNSAELLAQDKGALIAIADGLVKAGRLPEMPAGSKARLVGAILGATPLEKQI